MFGKSHLSVQIHIADDWMMQYMQTARLDDNRVVSVSLLLNSSRASVLPDILYLTKALNLSEVSSDNI